MSPLLRASLSMQRRNVIGWAIGLAGVVVLYAAFYPSIRDSSADLTAYLDKLPDAVKSVIGSDYTTPAGYLRAEVFSLLGPILLLVYAIGAGGKAIAGEEEARSLDLLLSTPLTRARVLGDKALALLATLVALSALVLVVIVVIGPVFGLSVPFADLAAACVMFLLIGVLFGSLALAVGAATGRRSWATAIAAGVAVAAYILNAVAPSVSGLTWARPLSPFRWYFEPDPLLTGVHPANVLALLAASAIFVVVAFWAFDRRDLAA
jgi:beta-exotoxin I transport system permease protein